jgi:hypothetical protein
VEGWAPCGRVPRPTRPRAPSCLWGSLRGGLHASNRWPTSVDWPSRPGGGLPYSLRFWVLLLPCGKLLHGAGNHCMARWGGAVAGSDPQPTPVLPACVAAQVLGLVGSARKRTLMIWQAVELSKMLGFPDASTLEVARYLCPLPAAARCPGGLSLLPASAELAGWTGWCGLGRLAQARILAQ